MNQIAIYGSGGFAREVVWLLESGKTYKVVCFIDDDPIKQDTIINNIPVYSLDKTHELFPDIFVVSGIGSPQSREITMQKAKRKGFAFINIIDPSVLYSTQVHFGIGVMICAGNILTVNIKLGDHVQINLGCTIGHDSILDEYTTLSPGVHISGFVYLGKRVYVGTGATIINGSPSNPITIADDVVIGAGAVVTKSITEPGITVVGVPAKPLNR